MDLQEDEIQLKFGPWQKLSGFIFTIHSRHIIGKFANYIVISIFAPSLKKWRQHDKYGFKIMIQARFVDDSTIEVTAQDGEKIIWNTYFPVHTKDHQYFAGRFEYYFQKYFEDNIGITTGMGLGYWAWIKMVYFEGLGIYGGKGDRDDERIFLNQERERIGARIRELRKEKNIEAKMLAQIANIDAANLSRIEQGRYSVGFDVLSKIAFALGAKIELVDFVAPGKS